MLITKEDFEEYVRIQKSGVTNMLDIARVIELSRFRLDRAKCKDIMINYHKYKEELL